jgi:H+/gluconate symporter-like permease
MIKFFVQCLINIFGKKIVIKVIHAICYYFTYYLFYFIGAFLVYIALKLFN